MNRFTATEWAVLLLYAQGLDGPEIAEKLSITKKTVDFHTRNLRLKTKTHTTHAAVAAACEITPREEFAPKPRARRGH